LQKNSKLLDRCKSYCTISYCKYLNNYTD